MSRPITFEELVALVFHDREIIDRLLDMGMLDREDGGFGARAVDRALATYTLVRELEVDWGGVVVILRLREELAEARLELKTLREKLSVLP